MKNGPIETHAEKFFGFSGTYDRACSVVPVLARSLRSMGRAHEPRSLTSRHVYFLGEPS